jgi:hypothetical protein
VVFLLNSKICNELVISESLAGVPMGQLNCEARLVAKSLDFLGESKTEHNFPFSG